ncbi:MAG TPA: hypothetical protein VIT00_08915, partial [Terrimicrobiaceae bacterium]
MRRALPTLLASAALAVAQQNPPAESQNAPQQPAPQQPAQNAPQQPAQNAPQQPAQNFPQPAMPFPARPAQGSGGDQSQSAAPAGGSNFLGKDVPFFDPGSNIASWDGKNWNISNNALFQARFEKFLNAPAATTESDSEYQALLGEIMDKLAPGKITPRSTDEAFQALAKASRYQQDSHLCDSIASQVYSAWLSRKSNDRLNAASKGLEDERKRLEWNARLTAEGTKLEGGGSSKSKEGGPNPQQQQQQLSRDMQMQPLVTRLAEVNALIRANQLKREVAELQVKIDFQSLIVQHFLQRRFQHAIIGTRFYR